MKVFLVVGLTVLVGCSSDGIVTPTSSTGSDIGDLYASAVLTARAKNCPGPTTTDDFLCWKEAYVNAFNSVGWPDMASVYKLAIQMEGDVNRLEQGQMSISEVRLSSEEAWQELVEGPAQQAHQQALSRQQKAQERLAQNPELAMQLMMLMEMQRANDRAEADAQYQYNMWLADQFKPQSQPPSYRTTCSEVGNFLNCDTRAW